MSHDRQGLLWKLVRRLSGRPRPGPRRDDQDEGLGVLVPAGPKPRTGGAAASIPPKPR